MYQELDSFEIVSYISMPRGEPYHFPESAVGQTQSGLGKLSYYGTSVTEPLAWIF